MTENRSFQRALCGGVIFRAKDTGRLLLCRQVIPDKTYPSIWTIWGDDISSSEASQAASLNASRNRTGYNGSADTVELGTYEDEEVQCYMYIANVPTEFAPEVIFPTWQYGWFPAWGLPRPMSSGLIELFRANKQAEDTLFGVGQAANRMN